MIKTKVAIFLHSRKHLACVFLISAIALFLTACGAGEQEHTLTYVSGERIEVAQCDCVAVYTEYTNNSSDSAIPADYLTVKAYQNGVEIPCLVPTGERTNGYIQCDASVQSGVSADVVWIFQLDDESTVTVEMPDGSSVEIELTNGENTTSNGNASITQFETEIIQFDIDYEECRYNAIVEIKNTGDTPLSIGYTYFNVEDSEGQLIATEDSSAIYAQPSIIFPGESGYYFTARLDLPSDIDSNKEYALKYTTEYISTVDIEQSNVDISVKDVSFPDNDYANIIGYVDTSLSGYADVVCICYDENHNIVTVGGTIIDTLDEAFEILNYAALGKTNIADYEIIARLNGIE